MRRRRFEELDTTPREHPNDERALREAIARDPSAAAAYLVYGDWLTEHGDALGELIAVGVALEQNDARRGALKERERELVAKLAPRFFGDFSGQGTVVWRRGFALRFAFGIDEPCRVPRIEELLSAYLLSPAALVVRDLVLGDVGETDEEIWYALGALALPRSLRRFAIGPQRAWSVEQASVGTLAPALARMPGLEVLVVGGRDIDLGEPSLPRLRRIELTTSSSSDATFGALARFDALDTVSIDLCDRGDVGALERVLPRLPAGVKSLNLRGLPSSAGIVDAILAWKHVATLEELTLARGVLSARDARKLLALAHLTRLDLADQLLPRDIVTALRGAFGARLSVGAQAAAD